MGSWPPPGPKKEDCFSLRRLRRRSEKRFIFILFALPEAGCGDFPALPRKKPNFRTIYPTGYPGTER
jgi:hypothetical protein